MKKLVVFLASFAAVAAHAQIVPIGPFTGAQSEGFESGSAWMFTPQQSGFNGTATFNGVRRGITPYDKWMDILHDRDEEIWRQIDGNHCG